MKKMARICLLAAVAGAVVGCSTLNNAVANRHDYYFGNLPDLKADNVEAYSANQNRVLNSLIAVAVPGLVEIQPATPRASRNSRSGANTIRLLQEPTKEEWRQIADVGLHYVDVRCDRFVDALFWMNRIRESTSRQIQYTGSAAAAALALVEASRELIGLTPLGFLLADQTVNNVGQGLLYELDPASVRLLIERQQTVFLGQLPTTGLTNRAIVIQTIQNFASICLPASIEAEVNRAVGNAEFRRVDYTRGDDDDAAAAGESGDGNTADAAADDPKEGTNPIPELAPRVEQVPGG